MFDTIGMLLRAPLGLVWMALFIIFSVVLFYPFFFAHSALYYLILRHFDFLLAAFRGDKAGYEKQKSDMEQEFKDGFSYLPRRLSAVGRWIKTGRYYG